jgi:subtilisin family serine protease
LPRFSNRIALFILCSASALAGAGTSLAASPEVVSTQCGEVDLLINGAQISSRLAGCGDRYDEDLLWHLDRIDQIAGTLDGTFDRRNGGAGSVVYVMDTGVMAAHSEFSGPRGSRVTAGYDVSGSVTIGTSRCTSDNKATAPCWEGTDELSAASHGTGVASIVAGENVGVAPKASIVSIRVMNERGLATTRTYLDGLDAIIRHAWDPASPDFRTAIVNISGWVLERLTASREEARTAVAYGKVEKKMREMISGVDENGQPSADGKRFLFVVAGNNLDGGCGTSGYVDRFPAILGREIDGLITVGGMTAENTSWRGACRGGLEVLAPAKGVFSATITGADHFRGRRLRSGTSFAAPVISGIAARLLADRPEMTPQQLESWITSTPSRVEDPDVRFAYGKVAYVRSIAPPSATIATLGE